MFGASARQSSQIYTAIAKSEKFCAEQILPAETTEMSDFSVA
jgi:hypothetical protein